MDELRVKLVKGKVGEGWTDHAGFVCVVLLRVNHTTMGKDLPANVQTLSCSMQRCTNVM